jgi:hypothetical protein
MTFVCMERISGIRAVQVDRSAWRGQILAVYCAADDIGQCVGSADRVAKRMASEQSAPPSWLSKTDAPFHAATASHRTAKRDLPKPSLTKSPAISAPQPLIVIASMRQRGSLA